MHEIIKLIKDDSFYHPQILRLIGNAFINSNPIEPILTDAVCLEELGAYLVNKLIQQPYKIPDQIINRIAYAKRWDATEKAGFSFKTLLNKSARDYQSIIDFRLNEVITTDTLGLTIRNILIKVFEDAPQYQNKIESMKKKVNESDLLVALHYLVERLYHLDAVLKCQYLQKCFKTTTNPHFKCTLAIMKVTTAYKGLSQDNIRFIIDNYEGSTLENIIKYNTQTFQEFNNYMLNGLNENGYIDSVTSHARNIDIIKKAVNETLVDFWRNPSAISTTQTQDLLSYLTRFITIIENDGAALNSLYNTFDQLLSELKSDALNAVSAELVANLMPSFKMIIDIKAQFENYIIILKRLKENIETLEHALPLGSSEVYLRLQKEFLEFDKRFAVPPPEMLESLKELQAVYGQVQTSVIPVKSFIKENDKTSNKTLVQDVNYLDHHKAYLLLTQIRQNIKKLEDKSLKFNVAKSKCFSFENTYSRAQRDIYDVVEEELCPVKKTFLSAMQSYWQAWQEPLKSLYSTKVVTAVEDLKRDLQELENTLSKLIEQREQVMQKNAVTPPAHNKYKARQAPSQGTPTRVNPPRAKRKGLKLFDSNIELNVELDQSKKQRLKPDAHNGTTDKENNLSFASRTSTV